MAIHERFTLLDVSITIQTEDGKNMTIGGCEEVSATITRNNEIVHEGGNYKAVEIISKKESVTGTLTRAFLDVETLKNIFPNSQKLPYFSLTGQTLNKEPARTIIILNAKADSINITNLSLDGYAKNNIPFSALGWDFI